MWVDYDPCLGSGQYVTLYWGDGYHASGFAKGYEFSAWHYLTTEGTYYPQAVVDGIWDTSTVFAYANPPTRCTKGILRCTECCINNGFGKNCENCCSTCYYQCVYGPACPGGSCNGCWIG
jgi:hypothetical protein